MILWGTWIFPKDYTFINLNINMTLWDRSESNKNSAKQSLSNKELKVNADLTNNTKILKSAPAD